MRVLVTGGAGFVGASVAVRLAERSPAWEVIAFDNLHRRGSELNLRRLGEAGVEFVHGDARVSDDLVSTKPIDAIIECSAEPSALAGVGGSPAYVVSSNLVGAYNCLELARRHDAYFLFLSTSRVYPVGRLRALALAETDTRLELAPEQPFAGASSNGIAEQFPLDGARTLYGATKLAAELLIEEYRSAYGLRAVIDRCGVIAGPWQLGNVDQGVFTYWMLAHHFRRPLQYIGFGGLGKQVRDLLHVEDLLELLEEQLRDQLDWDGAVVNVGGGRACSLSLRETTALCSEISGNRIEVGSVAETRAGDVPVYISDCAALAARSQWRPRRTPADVLSDIQAWISANETDLEHVL